MDCHPWVLFISVPLVSDKFGVRLSAKHDERDGLYKNSAGSRDELNNRDHSNVRLAFLYEGDSYQSHLSIEHVDMTSNAAFVSAQDAFESKVSQNDPVDDQTLSSWRTNWTNSFDLPNEMTLTSITGYYVHDVNVTPVDADLVDTFVVSFQEPQNAEAFSQEFRLNGESEALTWFVGGSYVRERLDFVNALAYDEAIVADLFGLNAMDTVDGSVCDGSIQDFGLFGLPTCPVSTETPQGDNITESFAVYGDATWHLSSDLDLTFGLRYTKDQKSMEYTNPATAGLLGVLGGQIFGPITPGQLKAKDEWTSLDPRIAVNYHLNSDVMAYASYSKGYKSGGLNRQQDPATGGILAFDKEQNSAFEFGVKSSLWDGRARFNAAVFYNDYSDFQLEELINLVPQVDNVGDVTVERAGTAIATRVIVLEKQTDPDQAAKIQQSNRDYSNVDSIEEFFDRLESSEIKERVAAKEVKEVKAVKKSGRSETAKKSEMETWEAEHSKTGDKLFMAKPKANLSREDYLNTKQAAKEAGGYWSRFGKAGFLFKSEEARKEFLDATAEETQSEEGPLFRRTPDGRFAANNRAAVSRVEAQQVIDRIVAGWRGAGRNDEVRLLDSFDDLPEEIKAEARRQGAEGGVDGVFHKGTVYIVRDELKTAEAVERVLFHEAYAHYGFANMFGKDVRVAMNELFLAIGGSKGLVAIAKKHGINLTGYAKGMRNWSADRRNSVMMEELLAHMQQDTRPGVVKKLKAAIGAIKNWLRAVGLPSYSRHPLP